MCDWVGVEVLSILSRIGSLKKKCSMFMLRITIQLWYKGLFFSKTTMSFSNLQGMICQSDWLFSLGFPPYSCVQITQDSHVSWVLVNFTHMLSAGLHIFRRIWRPWRRSRVEQGKWWMGWKLEFTKKVVRFDLLREKCERWLSNTRKLISSCSSSAVRLDEVK